jgi:hypothetical protein
VLKGIKLTLLVGPIVVFPVPQAVLESLQSVKVTSSGGDSSDSGFELRFTFSARSPLNTIFIVAAGQTPLLRVIIVATINSMPQVLIDGVMTKHSIEPGTGGGQSTLSVMGKDLKAVMGLQDFGGLPYPAMPVEARVALIMAKYAPFGIVPFIVPLLFPDPPIPVERIPTHQGTDLEYLETLASEAGYVFYIEPGPVPGTNIGYFGPQVKLGIPQPALNTDMDAHTNVESLSFELETDKASLPVVLIQSSLTRVPIPVPIPKLNPLQPPLGAIPPAITNVPVLRETAKLSPMAALTRGIAAASRSQDAVRGHGTLDVLRYGRILRARGLVGVRGAGMAFDGLYYVEQVTTTMKAGEMKQEFVLTRNGIVSILPTVPV